MANFPADPSPAATQGLSWVFRIATRISFHYLKRQKRWQDMENNPEFIRSIPIHTALRPEEVDADFLSLIEHVSPSSRAVLLLHYQQHLSLEETAAILDIPFGTAKSQLSYGVATVRKFLKEKEGHEHIRREKLRC